MRARSPGNDGYIVLTMLVAAAGGRLLDAGALLPGVHEARAVRGGSAAWLVALLVAALVGAAVATRWGTTQRLPAVAAIVLPGQAVAFLAAEAVVRLANGQGAVDPDGFIGAGLQAAFALLLLLALTIACSVVARCGSLTAGQPQTPADRAPGHPQSSLTTTRLRPALARGPPRTAGA